MSDPNRLEKIYSGVVEPEEFFAGLRFALKLEILEERAKRGEPLGVLRRVLANQRSFAVEFAPVEGQILQQNLGYTTFRLKWSNETNKGDPYVNTPTESLTNPHGYIFNNRAREKGRKHVNLQRLPASSLLGYFVEQEYAEDVAGELDPDRASDYKQRAAILGIKIP